MTEYQSEQEALLAAKLRELEALLAAREQETPPARQGNIPILDELVTDEDYAREEDAEAEPVASEPAAASSSRTPDIDMLASRLEEKFSLELDEIVNILKSNLKDSIMAELEAELQKDHQSADERE